MRSFGSKSLGLGWRSSTVEQLICNQQVVGSSPIASSSRQLLATQNRSGTTFGVARFILFRGKRERERFPSGQREQTVNLPAMPSKVRILPSPPVFAGIAQLVERKPSKLGVAGSSPVSRSSLRVWLMPQSIGRWMPSAGHQPYASCHRLICPGSSVGRARPW